MTSPEQSLTLNRCWAYSADLNAGHAPQSGRDAGKSRRLSIDLAALRVSARLRPTGSTSVLGDTGPGDSVSVDNALAGIGPDGIGADGTHGNRLSDIPTGHTTGTYNTPKAEF